MILNELNGQESG